MDIVAVRWRRYGKDRLYVRQDDGTNLGWHDLLDGSDHLELAEREAEYREAIARWRATATDVTAPPVAVPAPPPRPEAEDPAPPPVVKEAPGVGPPDAVSAAAVDAVLAPPAEAEPRPPEAATATDEEAEEDLAERRAGAMARERALALKAQAPFLTFLARLFGIRTEERDWRIGADGEELVGKELAKLTKADPRWRCLHSVPVGEKGSDIDHVVICPGGVFTLNTKHHPRNRVWVAGNTLMVNGKKVDHIYKSRSEVERAAKLLSAACGVPVAVQGLVVPVGAASLKVKEQPVDVQVVGRKSLASWLRKRPEVLRVEEIEVIFAAARRPSTWQGTGSNGRR